MAYQDLFFLLSGGAANENPNNSLGGAVSSAAPGGFFSPQKITTTPIPGLDVCFSKGAPTGQGYLIWLPSKKLLTWIPYGPSSPPDWGGPTYSLVLSLNMLTDGYPGTRYHLTVTEDGLFAIGESPVLVVRITQEYLPTENALMSVLIEEGVHNLFDMVSSSEASGGDTEYRCLWLKSTLPDTIDYMKIFVDQQPTNCTISLANEFIYVSSSPLHSETRTGAIVGMEYGDYVWNGPRVDAVLTSYYDWYVGKRIVGAADRGIGNQITDGVSGDIPAVLANENDTTNVLAGLEFYNEIEFFKPIEPNAVRSFWIRRVKSAGSVPQQTEGFSLKIQFEGG